MVEEQKSHLTSRCGHHCGVQMTGKHQYVGHCSCGECHDGKTPPTSEVPEPDPKESISE